MNVSEWSKSSVDYGRKLFASGLEAARSAEVDFLGGAPLTPFLDESARRALKPALAGVCVGLLSSLANRNRKSAARALAFGVLGGAVGFGLAMVWQSRGLTKSVSSAAWNGISEAREEHWFDTHPIDYA